MRPLLIEGGKGRISLMQYGPTAASRTDEVVLMIPPFAEEMNKSRRMLSLQAQRLAMRGFTVLLPDLYGTGDSGGDFVDARWEIWRDDILSCVMVARTLGARRCSVIALRLGALLAAECLPRMSLPVRRLVLWQPQTNGRQALTQFLRLRLAADLINSAEGSQSSTAALHRTLEDGNSVEVAGYELAPELANAIGRSGLEAVVLSPTIEILWIEVVAAGAGLSAASQKGIAAFRQRGFDVHDKAIQGDAFWTLQEISVVPGLLDETTSFLTRNARG
ncbi:MAG: hydrolase 2, exosortase A system-associated [Gammaproteobacteria bacterium]